MLSQDQKRSETDEKAIFKYHSFKTVTEGVRLLQVHIAYKLFI